MSSGLLVIVGGVVFVVIVVPVIVASFLRNVEAGTIRMVSWLQGGTVIYRGPGKSKEIPLLTTGTTISSKVINVDLDITDQTADIDDTGTPPPSVRPGDDSDDPRARAKDRKAEAAYEAMSAGATAPEAGQIAAELAQDIRAADASVEANQKE